jgi:DNA-binding transcriptional ArsR family regulator
MLSKENILALKTRQRIYHLICENPGLHIREISRRLDIPKTTLIHHIRYLKKQDIIKGRVEGGTKQIFASEKIGTQEKQILNLLRQKTPRRIFLHLIFSITCSQIELSKELELHPTTVTYHLKKMKDMDIIEEAPVRDGYIYPFTGPRGKSRKLDRKPIGREIFYRRKSQEIINVTCNILIKYKHSLSDEKIIDDYLTYLDQCNEEPRPKNRTKLKSVDGYMNDVMDTIEELFRPPFCA